MNYTAAAVRSSGGLSRRGNGRCQLPLGHVVRRQELDLDADELVLQVQSEHVELAVTRTRFDVREVERGAAAVREARDRGAPGHRFAQLLVVLLQELGRHGASSASMSQKPTV